MLFAVHTTAGTQAEDKRGPLMDPKIAILFALIGTIIALSYLTEENLRRLRRPFAGRAWRHLMPSRRRF
jgi:hypothetical protein